MSGLTRLGWAIALTGWAVGAHPAGIESVSIAVDPAVGHVFVGPSPDGTTPIMYVVTGEALTALPVTSSGTPRPIPLASGISAFDLADTDGDGAYEIVGFQGGSVIRIPLTGEEGAPETLFTAPSLYSGYNGPPFPTVLVTPFEDAPAVAVPLEGGFEFRRFDGALAKRFEPEGGTQALSPFGASFTTYPVEPPRIAPRKGGLELRVEQTLDYSWWLSKSVFDEAPFATANGRPATALQARDAATRPVEAWPWFPMHEADDAYRVLFSYVSEPDEATVVRLQRPRAKRTQSAPSALEVTPPRRYPGTLVMSETTWPDFDGDGIHDLFLWQSPQPGFSIDTFTRAAQDGTWPIAMTLHTFDSDQGIYRGGPAAALRTRLPIVWFLAQQDGNPLRNVLTEDLNGDGLSDVGMLTSPRQYAIWLGAEPFPDAPRLTATFREPIGALAMVGHVGPPETTVIALWGASHLYALYVPSGAE